MATPFDRKTIVEAFFLTENQLWKPRCHYWEEVDEEQSNHL